MTNKNNSLVMGIDEAGRGSIIGPLVIGGVVSYKNAIDVFKRENIKDSKKLNAHRREELVDVIKNHSIETFALEISPIEIDSALKDPTTNLNILEIKEMVKLILNYQSDEIIIDAVGKPPYFLKTIHGLLKQEDSITDVHSLTNGRLKITRKKDNNEQISYLLAENKADDTYPIVSAASIIAKVHRDKIIRQIEIDSNLETNILASGYPNQQLMKFLDQYKKEIRKKEFEFIRYSWDWEPLKKIVNKSYKSQRKLYL